MTVWIIAALVGAVPLYFSFAFGRTRQGTALWIAIGVCMSLTILAWQVAASISAASTASALVGFLIAWIGAVATCGMVAGALYAALVQKDRA